MPCIHMARRGLSPRGGKLIQNPPREDCTQVMLAGPICICVTDLRLAIAVKNKRESGIGYICQASYSYGRLGHPGMHLVYYQKR